MRIGIFEIDHYEFAYSLCRLFDYRENRIYFFVNQSIYEQLRHGLGRAAEKCYWYVMEERDTLNFFLNKAKHIIENEEIRLLFVNSVYSDFGKYLSFIKNTETKIIITLHNINNWIKPNEKGLKGYFEKRNKKNIIKNSDAVNVFGEAMKKHFLSLCKYKKPVFTLPYAIYEHSKIPESTNNKIEFIIPGSIDSRRRDYHTALNAFEKAFESSNNISLTLAGKPIWDYGREITARCRKIKDKGINIHWYDDFVPQHEFEKIMHGCDMIVAPVNLEMPFGSENEIYGITKATGATFDMARYAKPGIMPEVFDEPSELSTSIIKYKNCDDLASLMVNISSNVGYLTELKHKALINSHHFSVDVIREKIEPEIQEIFKSDRW